MRSYGDFILNEFVSVLSGKFKLNSFSNLISVVGFKMDSETPRGFDLPKVPFALYSDGVTRKRLVKGNDGLMQNSVMEQVFNMKNRLLCKNMPAHNLSMRLYKLLHLSLGFGLVDRFENTMPIGQYRVGPFREAGHLKYGPRDSISAHIRSILRACRDKKLV